MKKTTIILVGVLLCLKKRKGERPKLKAYLLIIFLLCLFNGQLLAQEIKTLNLGQKLPASIFSQKFLALNINTPQVDSLSLGQFKGKLILLDFWAVWCTNCIYKFELLTQLQAKYQSQFQVVLVNSKYTKDTPMKMMGILKGENAPFIKSSLISIYNDEVFYKLFPHSYLPHYVWLGAKGEVLAVTGAEMVNEQTVQQFTASIIKQNEKALAELNKKP